MRPRYTLREYSVSIVDFQKLKNATQISCNPLGVTLSSWNRDAINSDGYDGTRADAEDTAAD